MKKLIVLLIYLSSILGFSQELMNFYITPNTATSVKLHTSFFSPKGAIFTNLDYLITDNTINVTLCYLKMATDIITFDDREIVINLPSGHTSFNLNIKLLGGTATIACNIDDLIDDGTYQFNFPFIENRITFIPDNNFEIHLENLGLGDGSLNDLVLSNRIENIHYLRIGGKDIVSFIGIEDFIAVKKITCAGNLLTELDLSNNTNLEKLFCQGNLITTLDFTNNTNLRIMTVGSVQLTNINLNSNTNLEVLNVGGSFTTIDLSNNINLLELSIGGDLIILDLSNNTLLRDIDISHSNISALNLSNLTSLETASFSQNNLLTELDFSMLQNINTLLFGFHDNLNLINLQNGNNQNIETFTFTNIYDTCIQVDDINNIPNGWSIAAEGLYGHYSEDCSVISVADTTLNNSFNLYPNPIKDVVFIDNLDNILINNLQVYTVLGKLALTQTSGFNMVNMANFSAGIYVLKIETEQGVLVKKVVKK